MLALPAVEQVRARQTEPLGDRCGTMAVEHHLHCLATKLLRELPPWRTARRFQHPCFLGHQWTPYYCFSLRSLPVRQSVSTSGNLDNGHWCRFHRFFSHAAWDLDV